MPPNNSFQVKIEYPSTETIDVAPYRNQDWTPSPTPTVNPINRLEDVPKIEPLDKNKVLDMDLNHVNNIEESGLKKKKKRMEGRGCCCRCLGCACIPFWASCVVWFFVISIIIVIIVLGSVAATFKMPTVELQGVATPTNDTSQLSFSDYSIMINLGLIVNVTNPNLFSIKLSKMSAIAYYPIDDREEQVGTGYLDSQFVPKYSNINFTFPFSLSYDPSVNSDLSVINELIDKCGLTGNEKRSITVNYRIKLAATVLFITVHPTITSSATFECPIDSNAFDGFEKATTPSFEL